MNESNTDGMIYFSHKATIERFAEKAELLAAEAYDIFNKDRYICKIIGLIIIHQAAELALKANCLKQERTIIKSGNITITFSEAVKRSNNVLGNQESEILNILNIIRNNHQHSALFDISDIDDMKYRIIDTISIIVKVLENVGYLPNELNLILSHEESLSKNNSENSIRRV